MLNHLRQVAAGFLCVAVALAFGGVAHAAAGRSPTSNGVSQSGEAQYSIPIFTPPGTKSLTPQLALAYGHRAGESVAGIGWNIAGLSVMHRCPKTVAQDGSPDGISLTTADRICLDGNQLRLVSGSYGVAGSTYRLEVDTAARVTAVGTAGNGPASFTVEQANGLIYEYGNSADSRIESLATGFTTTARAWALNKIRDREGNAITFTWTEDGAPNGDFRIASVSYTSNSGQGLSALYTVAFTFATQPATDVDSAYLAGGRVDDVKRLMQVDVTHNSTATLVRRYKVGYEDAPVTGRSRVISVQECAGSDTNCYPATQFQYQNGSQGFGTMVSAGSVNGPLAIDINGDGRTDVVYSTTATSGTGFWAYRLANSSGGYATAVTTTFANHNFSQAVAIDYNADGRDDILVPCSSGTTWCVIQGTTTGLQSPINTSAPSTSTSKAMAIDWNGDGLDDLLWVDGVFAYVRLRVWGSAFAATATTVRSDVSAFNNVTDQARSRRRGLDVNGDGKRDFVYMQTSATFPPTLAFWVSLGGSTNVWSLSTVVGGNAKAIDINGDGYSDVFYGVSNSSVLLWRFSTGASFGPQVSGPSLVGYDVDRAVGVDYDGDGFEDVVLPNCAAPRDLHVFRM